ncbi:TraR/DksA C4-type zinc finger protein [Photobacterium leiognathi]|uniref:TraR/DksA family transcriptional regulator n=1 Tax=Photobacterium leiognathi TaxID=553611 RepID=UPI001EDE0502|nr:TraR/DksA C4-type zinc finger protein [Photobacterium leiognathi]MCG3883721.1 TraR/DksA C4-type zinc finger protein [Photobacterium leiognathi]
MNSTIEDINLNEISSHLEDEQKKDIFTKLNGVISKGEQRVTELKEHFSSIDIANSDPLDRAESSDDRERTLREIEREKKNISIARKIIAFSSKHGEYGYCLNNDCGVDIPYAKLSAYPLTLLCLDCKAREEAMQKYNPTATLASI